MSVLSLPEPAAWRSGRTLLVVALAGAIAVAAVYIVLGVVAATRGNYLTTAVAFGWAAFLVAFSAAVLLVGLGRTKSQFASDSTGLTVLPDPRFGVLMLVGLVVLIPSSVAFAVCAPFGAIEFADSRGLQTIGAGFAAIVAFVAVLGLITSWRRGGVGHVKLTPAMIETVDILTKRVCEWDDVIDVVDHAESRKTRRAVVLRLRDGSEEVIDIVDIYLPRGAALYWLVRHYWRHPEDRMELVDSRAPGRLHDGRFDMG